jgi:hypothetical protein
MPGGDRTGPMGQGPRTGRGAGYCGGADMPGYANALPGGGRGGFGRGRGGGGRGWRHWFHATRLTGWQRGMRGGPWGAAPAEVTGPAPSRDEQLSLLRADLRCFEQTVAQLRQRIEALAGPAEDQAGA